MRNYDIGVNRPLLGCGVPSYELPILSRHIVDTVPPRFDHFALMMIGVGNAFDVKTASGEALDCAMGTVDMMIDQYGTLTQEELAEEGYAYLTLEGSTITPERKAT